MPVSYLRLYLSAVRKQWIVLLTGSGISAILGWLEHILGVSVLGSLGYFIATLFLGVLYACYRAWCEEHKRYLDEVDRLGRPDIRGEIQDFIGGAIHGNVPQRPGEKLRPAFNDVFQYYEITVRVYFANHTDVPVSLKNFGLEINDSQGIYLARFPEPGEIRVFDAALNMPMGAVLNLNTKIGEQSTRGLAFEGCLRFRFTDMKELRPKAIFTLIVADALNNNHRITNFGYVRPLDRIIHNLSESDTGGLS